MFLSGPGMITARVWPKFIRAAIRANYGYPESRTCSSRANPERHRVPRAHPEFLSDLRRHPVFHTNVLWTIYYALSAPWVRPKRAIYAPLMQLGAHSASSGFIYENRFSSWCRFSLSRRSFEVKMKKLSLFTGKCSSTRFWKKCTYVVKFIFSGSDLCLLYCF